MEYYYELLSLMSKVGVEEPEKATQDRFIHGLNITLKHKVQVEALRGISLCEVLGFAEAFERQGKELAISRTRVATSQPGGGASASKWGTQIKKVEEPGHASAQVKTPYKALPGPQPIKATLPTENKKVQCFKCKGFGHYAREDPNQRVMVIGQDGSVYSEDVGYEGVEGECEVSPDPNIAFSSDEEEDAELRALVVLRMLISVQPDHEEHKEQRCNIFHRICKVKTKTCLVIIDGESCTNVVSEQLVAKLGLTHIKHPNPYKLQWLGEAGELRVKVQSLVPLRIGDFEEEVLCDIIPKTACHVLLGRPWEFDKKAYKMVTPMSISICLMA